MKRILLSLIALLVISIPAHAAGLRIITEISPPLNYTDDGTETGKPMGQAVDIVMEIQKRAGDTTPIEVMPWARGYDLIQKESNVVLFSTTRTPARESLFQWIGPVGTNEWVFVTKKGSSVKADSLEDAKKVGSIGAYKNDAREAFLKEQGFTNLDSADDTVTLMKKTLSGRNDLWLTDKQEYVDLAKSQKIDPSELSVVMSVKKTELALALSKGVDAGILEKWQKAFADMKADGTYDKILAKWAK